MRIERDTKGWFIVKGRGRRESFFCFFVDDDSSCWTGTQPWHARYFRSENAAHEALVELKRRANLARDRRKALRETR